MAGIRFYHSAFADNYEKQANEQGYTLGERAEEFDKVAFSYNMLRIGGHLTEKQADSVCMKIQKRLVANLKPLPNEGRKPEGEKK